MDIVQSLLNALGSLIPSSHTTRDYRAERAQQIAQGMKLAVNDKLTVAPDQPAPTPDPVMAQASPAAQSAWRSKFQDIYDKVASGYGITPNEYRFLIQTENGQEDPGHINKNSDGTIDVGLLQVNADPKNTAEVERLKNPEYNIQKGLQILSQRKQNLQDPVLALGSYNLGAGGAALQPEQALNRVKDLSQRVGLEVPQTDFTKNPLGFVRQRMDSYKRLGLIKQ